MIEDEERQGVVFLDRVVKKVSLRRLLPKTSLSRSLGKENWVESPIWGTS